MFHGCLSTGLIISSSILSRCIFLCCLYMNASSCKTLTWYWWETSQLYKGQQVGVNKTRVSVRISPHGAAEPVRTALRDDVFIYVSCSHTVHLWDCTETSKHPLEWLLSREKHCACRIYHPSVTVWVSNSYQHSQTESCPCAYCDSQFTMGPNTNRYGYLKQMHTQVTELTM